MEEGAWVSVTSKLENNTNNTVPMRELDKLETLENEQRSGASESLDYLCSLHLMSVSF